MNFVGRQHREHVRGLARLVRLFVGDQLDRFLVIVLVFKIGPLALLIGRPERAAAINDLFAVLVNDRLDIDAAGRGNCEVVSGVALVVSVYIRRTEFALVQNVGDVFIFVAVVLDFLLDLLVFLLDEFEGDFFGNCFARVISGLHANLRRVALVIEKAFGIGVGDSFPAGTDEGSRALHLATRGVSDLGFQAI